MRVGQSTLLASTKCFDLSVSLSFWLLPYLICCSFFGFVSCVLLLFVICIFVGQLLLVFCSLLVLGYSVNRSFILHTVCVCVCVHVLQRMWVVFVSFLSIRQRLPDCKTLYWNRFFFSRSIRSLWKINIDFGHSIGTCSEVCVWVCVSLWSDIVWALFSSISYIPQRVCECVCVHACCCNAMQVNNHFLLAIILFEWKRWPEKFKP